MAQRELYEIREVFQYLILKYLSKYRNVLKVGAKCHAHSIMRRNNVFIRISKKFPVSVSNLKKKSGNEHHAIEPLEPSQLM